jgi:polyadenylation factor subunit 2
MKDRFHIGEEAAEAQGTWNRGFGRRQMREEEEQELQDEAEGLVDQKFAAPTLPGIQGAPLPGTTVDGAGSQGFLPGIGNIQPPPQPRLPTSLPNVNPSQLASMLGASLPPQQNGFAPQDPGLPGFGMPGLPGTPPLNLNLAELQKQLLAQLPPNFAAQKPWSGS